MAEGVAAGGCPGLCSRFILWPAVKKKKKSMEPLESVLQLGTTLRLFCCCSKPQLDPFISTLPPSGFPLFLLQQPVFSSPPSSSLLPTQSLPCLFPPFFFILSLIFTHFFFCIFSRSLNLHLCPPPGWTLKCQSGASTYS